MEATKCLKPSDSNRYVRPTATAPHSDSTISGRRRDRCKRYTRLSRGGGLGIVLTGQHRPNKVVRLPTVIAAEDYELVPQDMKRWLAPTRWHKPWSRSRIRRYVSF